MNGSVWMPQRLKCLNDIQKFEKSSEKTVSRDCKWISLKVPRTKISKWHSKVWKKLKTKICIRVCIWISLNAPRTKMPEWHSEVWKKLRTKQSQEGANGSVWMPQWLKFQNYIQKFEKKLRKKNGQTGWKYISLNALRTKMVEWHSVVWQKLRTRLAQEAADRSVWSPLD